VPFIHTSNKLMLQMKYNHEGFGENAGDFVGVAKMRLRTTSSGSRNSSSRVAGRRVPGGERFSRAEANGSDVADRCPMQTEYD
jgi:hypothetical protein